MKKNINKFFIILIIVLISIFSGYENPKLVEIPKKYFYFALKKIGLRDNFLNQQIDGLDHKEETTKSNEFRANSFSVILTKLKSFSGLSSSLIMSKNGEESEYEIFTQEGFKIEKNRISEMNLPISFYKEQAGGVKSVFTIEDENYALISAKKLSCFYASLINLRNSKEILKSKCLPDNKGIQFSGLGGAYIKTENEIILSIGVPAHKAEKISALAQKKNSIFGKMLLIENKVLLDQSQNEINYKIYSSGHRNPQGLVLIGKRLFSLEHGPHGGDELNEIIEGENYGWPIASLGTEYGTHKSYESHASDNFKKPLFVFIPAVAPSALNVCPKNLSQYYKSYDCLMGLSLKAMSILVFLIEKDTDHVVSVEKIFLNKRLRHFGLEKKGNLFLDEDENFYITADGDGLYKIKFTGFIN